MKIAVSRTEIALSIGVFLVLMAAFTAFSTYTGWPNSKEGWPLATGSALALALLPLIVRGLGYLGDRGGSVEALGVKFNIASAVEGSKAASWDLPGGAFQDGAIVPESTSEKLLAAAREAYRHKVVVVDVEAGGAWLLTRLFALAATAEFMGSPQLLVLIGQAGGQPRRIGGCITPGDLVRAVTLKDERFAHALRTTRGYMQLLEAQTASPPPHVQHDPVGLASFSKLNQYHYQYAESGDAIFMKVLVDELKTPDPPRGGVNPPPADPVGGVAKPPLETRDNLPWTTLADLRLRLDPWLLRDLVELTDPLGTQIAAILAARGEWAIAARNGAFDRLIVVERAVRHIVRQLVDRSELKDTRQA